MASESGAHSTAVDRLLQFADDLESEADIEVALRKSEEWRRHVATRCITSYARNALLQVLRRYFARWRSETHTVGYRTRASPPPPPPHPSTPRLSTTSHEQCEAAIRTWAAQVQALKEENAALRDSHPHTPPACTGACAARMQGLEDELAGLGVQADIAERECHVKVEAARKQFEETHAAARQARAEHASEVQRMGFELQQAATQLEAAQRACSVLRAENQDLQRKLTTAHAAASATEDSCNAKLLGMGGMVTSLQTEVDALRRGDTRSPPRRTPHHHTWLHDTSLLSTPSRGTPAPDALLTARLDALCAAEAAERAALTGELWREHALCFYAEACDGWQRQARLWRKSDALSRDLQAAERSAAKAADAMMATHDKAHRLEAMLGHQVQASDTRRDAARSYEVKYAVLKEKYRQLGVQLAECKKSRDTAERELRHLVHGRVVASAVAASPSPPPSRQPSLTANSGLLQRGGGGGGGVQQSQQAQHNAGVRHSEPSPTPSHPHVVSSPSPLRDYRTKWKVRW